MKVQKGETGYIAAQKKRRLLITAGLFALPVAVFVLGLLYFGKRENVLTVVAVVGCLPGCRSMVGLIMMMMQKPGPGEMTSRIQAHAGELIMAYELFFTTYEKSVYVDAAAVCGNTVVCYTKNESRDRADFIQEHLQKMIRHNGYPVSVRVMTGTIDKFLERLDGMNKNRDSLQEGIIFSPDPKYPGMSRDEMVRHIMLTLAL
ncbi:hypothetical protein MCG98_13280 [Ruminococcus sp. OA3]|uniref:hypothetical protein n=1 Tax=Ruminococcus sp. OA3 TaxID=2914164 RepID=UPI001F056ED6|nr:hypothetical protein [Ruminococcus sp. OA3]MCH1983539.1 hypothetical protein [Ruminococcus sp. OA3]